jgi:hypothetical protein
MRRALPTPCESWIQIQSEPKRLPASFLDDSPAYGRGAPRSEGGVRGTSISGAFEHEGDARMVCLKATQYVLRSRRLLKKQGWFGTLK